MVCGAGGALGSAGGLVVAGGVECQLTQELAGGGVDDPGIEVVDQEQDVGSGVGAAGADVVELAVVAEGYAACLVDDVAADAMVDWLYSRDATSELAMPVKDAMLDDPRHGLWYAEPFTEGDLDAAAAWLQRQGLVKGITVDQCVGPIRLYLTDSGVRCTEEHESDRDRYLAAQRNAPGSGPVLNNSGPVQVAGDHAHQVQNVGASADELRALVGGIAEMVRALVPDAADIAEQERLAPVAASPGKVDRSMLRRFADWAVSTVRAGATAALVPAVTAATNEMLAEAGRLTGHL